MSLRDALIAGAGRFEMPAYPRLDLVAARGEGARLFDLDGTAYLDLYGGHAVALLGHSPPCVVDAIAEQARALLFYSNVVHAPARVRAAERLCRLAPWDDAQVFFVNSGAEANETAVKIARKATGRDVVVGVQGGFHGRTLGALAVGSLGHYRDFAAPVVDPSGLFRFVERGGALDAIDGRVACVIVEPIQSMGGVHPLGREWARALRERCDAAGAKLVFDEVQTAPARTGTWFCGEHWGVKPDLITSAKGVAAGFPAGIVLASGAVAATVESGDQGTTFGGGPVAGAAIDATLAELERIDGPACARAIEGRVREALPGREVRGLGGLLGVVVDDAKTVVRRLREEHRVLSGTCPGDPRVVRLFPPLNITDGELEEGLDALRRTCA